jgi:oligopeptide transport system substrate-binding protein
MANASDDFLEKRQFFHLKKVLLAQFSLQSKMEKSLEIMIEHPLHLKLFRCGPSQIAVAIASHTGKGIQQTPVLESLQSLLPSAQLVPGSAFVWHHPIHPYQFSYFEVQKLRGKEPSAKAFRKLEKDLARHLTSISPLTPALFWPFNREDSFRQIQLLQREMRQAADLPHASIHFQEQTNDSLEFLIHLVRPAGEVSLDLSIRLMPNTSLLYSHIHKSTSAPFPIEIGAFSMQISSFSFQVRESINLLYARRYVHKCIEDAIGPFRDINGGLLVIQQQHFEAIRSHLAGKIADFDLFAEKLFYALHPVEAWLTLTLSDAEAFFEAFSTLFREQSPYGKRVKKDAFAIIKTPAEKAAKQLEVQGNISHTQLIFGDSRYLCLVGRGADNPESLVQEPSNQKPLSLYFQEGPLPSLNPHFSSADMRQKITSKLLFEGLMRLGSSGKPECAGAESVEISPDALTYTFTLRETRWSNGEKVSAADYISSWKTALSDSFSHPEQLKILNKKTGASLAVSTPHPSTLIVELEEADPEFLYKLAQPSFFPIFGSSKEPKWFNGPYLLHECNESGALLDKNAYYWDKDSCSIPQISLSWSKPELSPYELFQKEKIDWVGDPFAVLPLDALKDLKAKKKLLQTPVKRRMTLILNAKHPILGSSSMRKALRLCIDTRALCEELYPASVPLSDCDLASARFHFEAGLKELGLKKADLPPLTFHYSSHERRDVLVRHLSDSWNQTLGISVLTQVEDWNHFRNRIEERNFCIACVLLDTSLEPSIEYYERFEGANSWNFGGWTHEEYRNHLSQRHVVELAKLLREESPYISLFDYAHLYAKTDGLEGYRIDSEGCIDFSRATFQKESVLK